MKMPDDSAPTIGIQAVMAFARCRHRVEEKADFRRSADVIGRRPPERDNKV